MNTSEDILIFRGDSNEAAEKFIRAVYIQAFKTNKIDDQSWITGFASTAFAGNALRWYRTLPVATRQDWDLLQAAILSFDWQKNAQAELGPAVPATTIASHHRASLPQAANSCSQIKLSPSPAHIPLPSRVSHGSWLTGRIKVTIGDHGSGYMTLPAGHTRVRLSLDPRLAIRVGWDPSSFPCHLRILGTTSQYCMLGGQCWNTDNVYSKFGVGNTGHLLLVPVTDPLEGPIRTLLERAPGGHHRGPAYAAIWSVLEDGSLLATVKQGGCNYQFATLVSSPHGLMWLASDPKAASAAWPEGKAKTASLRLEMLDDSKEALRESES